MRIFTGQPGLHMVYADPADTGLRFDTANHRNFGLHQGLYRFAMQRQHGVFLLEVSMQFAPKKSIP